MRKENPMTQELLALKNDLIALTQLLGMEPPNEIHD